MSPSKAQLAAALALLALMSSGQASGADYQTAIHPPMVAINYHDLDLTTAQGAAAMLSRIAASAVTICRLDPTNGGYDPTAGDDFVGCQREHIGAAVSRLGSPRVTMLWRTAPRSFLMGRR